MLPVDLGIYKGLIAGYGFIALWYAIRRGGLPYLGWAAWLVHTAWLVVRWVEVGRTPITSLYETLSIFAWSGTLALLIVQKLGGEKLRWSGVITYALMEGAMAYGLTTGDAAAKPLAPALDAVWFEIHVIPAFVSYALFVTAFALEMEYLLGRARVEAFNRLSRRLISFGFPLLTFAIFSGGAWAEEAWGSYWSWDPKETASLVTWCVYAAFLHASRTPALARIPARVLNIAGFLAMMFTFLGFNLIAKWLGLPSLHAYV